jgi:hypothetical protein
VAEKAGRRRRSHANSARERAARWQVSRNAKIAWPANDNTPPPLGVGARFLTAAGLALCGLLVLALVAFVF